MRRTHEQHDKNYVGALLDRSLLGWSKTKSLKAHRFCQKKKKHTASSFCGPLAFGNSKPNIHPNPIVQKRLEVQINRALYPLSVHFLFPNRIAVFFHFRRPKLPNTSLVTWTTFVNNHTFSTSAFPVSPLVHLHLSLLCSLLFSVASGSTKILATRASRQQLLLFSLICKFEHFFLD